MGTKKKTTATSNNQQTWNVRVMTKQNTKMCRLTMESDKNETADQTKPETEPNESLESSPISPGSVVIHPQCRSRRPKRLKQSDLPLKNIDQDKAKPSLVFKKKRISDFAQRHENDSSSGGIGSIIPSLIGVLVLGGILLARSGFRGRATVAGIDLGTTNSVVCVQEQAAKEGVGKINCIPDPNNLSPIIPSVVSFLDHHQVNLSTTRKKSETKLFPHPDDVVVGEAAKKRIDSHPHHTLYHAKRVLGRKFQDKAVEDLIEEVEFTVIPMDESMDEDVEVTFAIPYHSSTASHDHHATNSYIRITPQQVGAYVVNYLMTLTRKYLGHDNIKSAVIAVPAKFDAIQRQATVEAFRLAGIKVARILEEPVAAALAYGLQKKANVDYIIVYDFGGGTLDVSVLQVSKDGYVEVMGSDGDENLGGADFDASVAHFLLDGEEGKRKDIERVVFAVSSVKNSMKSDTISNSDFEESLFSQCPTLRELPLCSLSSFHTMGEQMKIELSSFEFGGGSVSKRCLGFPDVDNWQPPSTIEAFCSLLKPLTLTLTSEQYDFACQSLYDRSMLPMRRLLGDLELKAKDIDEVVMVGGTTRMPKIRQMVQDELRISSLNTHIDPDLTVAVGAASVID